MKYFNAFIFISLLLFGCTEDKEDSDSNDEEITFTEEDTSNEYQSPESGYVFEPNLVFFYFTIVVDNETDIGCFNNGSGSPYCGVFKYLVVNREEWTGFDDMAHACHVVHKIDPAHVVSSGPISPTDWHGWTFDAAQTYAEKSLMCSFIDINSDAGKLIDSLIVEQFSLGIGPAIPAMNESFESYVVNNSSQDNWDNNFEPYIMSSTVSVGNFKARPNFIYAAERKENGVPVVINNSLQLIESTNLNSLINAWYVSRPWYGYTLDKFAE